MALFGNNGFFDNAFETVKKNPLETVLTGGLNTVMGGDRALGAVATGGATLATEGAAKIGGKFAGGVMSTLGQSFQGAIQGAGVGQQQGQGTLLTDEQIKQQQADTEGRADAQRFRQKRSGSGTLLSSNRQRPSLLG